MKLYIGNLPFSTTEAEVREMLEQHGTLQSFNWITDRDTGRPRGFCFAEMNNADADAAIKALNGKDLGGRNLKVNEARARNDRRKKRSW
jgi:RNA recognition motif-containing protein